MQFSSCFIEVCLPTCRSYILSTGVTSRGTRGSKIQTFQVDGRIQISVDLLRTLTAAIHALIQFKWWLYTATIWTSLGGGEESIRKEHFTTIPLALISHLTLEFMESHIRNRLRQFVILEHAAYIQALQHNSWLGFRQLAGDLMQRIGSNVRHLACAFANLITAFL